MMRIQWLFGLAGFLASVDAVIAQDVSSTSQSNASNTETTVTVTVKATGNNTIKDFHLRPPKKGVTLKPGSISVTNGGGSSWSENDLTSAGADLTTSGDGLVAGSNHDTMSFTVTISHGTDASLTFKEVQWFATNDGSGEIKKGSQTNVVGEGGPTTGGGMVLFPVNSLVARPQHTVIVPGTEFPFVLETNLADQAYRVYSATALSTTSGGADDPLGIGVDTDAPLPSEWGVEIHGVTGTFRLDVDGERRASPTISIPNDLSMVGRVFYLVGGIDSDGDSRPDIFTRIGRVTVRNPGSTENCLEFLDPIE